MAFTRDAGTASQTGLPATGYTEYWRREQLNRLNNQNKKNKLNILNKQNKPAERLVTR
jgi:hypothetical protein